MSPNSQLLNIINDIEELNEATKTINGNIGSLQTNKQNKIQVTDTIQISKLKTQYITMSLTGKDLQTELSTLGSDISSNANDIDDLQTLTSTHTSNISSNADDITELQTLTSTHTSNISSNADDITDLQTLTATHTSQIGTNTSDIDDLQTLTSTHTSNIATNASDISTKQVKITDQTDIFPRDITCDNIIMRPQILKA